MHILHADAHILVVDKPAGLPVLPDGWEKDAPYLLKILEADHSKLWVVHRLDKITSGVILFARNAEAHRALNTQFEIREAEKVYHTLVEGNPPWKEKTARHPLRIDVGHKHRTIVDDRAGKPSETGFRVLKQFPPRMSYDLAAALVEAKPATGRTHQVRVHASALGHPLLGDLLYGAEESEVIKRPALHARSLTITHPGTNERLTFSAEYPADFATALKLL